LVRFKNLQEANGRRTECSEHVSTAEVTVAKRRKAGGDALTAWQEQNPLRQWRLAQPPEGWNRSVLARQLEVSHTAVASWENGKRLPMVVAFAKIEKLTGITATQWMDWYNRKPEET
jgi:ribosome-binding protein aMBF1 (putative translation factor)